MNAGTNAIVSFAVSRDRLEARSMAASPESVNRLFRVPSASTDAYLMQSCGWHTYSYSTASIEHMGFAPRSNDKSFPPWKWGSQQAVSYLLSTLASRACLFLSTPRQRSFFCVGRDPQSPLSCSTLGCLLASELEFYALKDVFKPARVLALGAARGEADVDTLEYSQEVRL